MKVIAAFLFFLVASCKENPAPSSSSQSAPTANQQQLNLDRPSVPATQTAPATDMTVSTDPNQSADCKVTDYWAQAGTCSGSYDFVDATCGFRRGYNNTFDVTCNYKRDATPKKETAAASCNANDETLANKGTCGLTKTATRLETFTIEESGSTNLSNEEKLNLCKTYGVKKCALSITEVLNIPGAKCRNICLKTTGVQKSVR